jgi:uncharacterized protein
MQLIQKYEVNIDYCPICKGVWLNRGEIDKIANIQNRYEDAHYQKYHYGQNDYDDYDAGYYRADAEKIGASLETYFIFNYWIG